MSERLPGAYGGLGRKHPEVMRAYAALGAACAEAGPLTPRERRLVKLALAIGAGSEGATHSHARRALEEGLDADAARQVALLAIGALGLPRAVAGLTWIEDILKDA